MKLTLACSLFAAAIALGAGCTTDAGDDPATSGDYQGPGGATPDVDGAAHTVIPIVRRGVDRASAFSTHDAKILHDDFGVTWTGVYIGGECSAGSGWSKKVVQQLHDAVGWKFMPIFVGQQSPSICHAHELSFAKGHADGDAAAAIMRSYDWHGNRAIPVALDVEAGTYEYSAKESTEYVKGFVDAVHMNGFLAYVYSSPTGLVHFHDANIGVNGGWVASYFYDEFKKLEPSDLHQIGDRYVKHNRAWQYAGDFEVPGVGRVDGNTSQLLLAPVPGGTNLVKTENACDTEEGGASGGAE